MIDDEDNTDDGDGLSSEETSGDPEPVDAAGSDPSDANSFEASPATDDDGYKVGYGKPPRHSQFKKGDPRHRVRRKRRKKTIGAIIEEELARSVPVEEGGRRRNYTMDQVMVRRLVNAAAKGDLRANKLLMEWRIRFKDTADTALGVIDEDDAAILDDFLSRQKEKAR